VSARRFDVVIRAALLGLPQVDCRPDSAVEQRITAATAGQPFVLFRREAMAARDKRRFVTGKDFEIDAFGRETGLNCRATRARSARRDPKSGRALLFSFPSVKVLDAIRHQRRIAAAIQAILMIEESHDGANITPAHQVTSDVPFNPKSKHWNLVSECPPCAKSGHYAVQQSIAPIAQFLRHALLNFRQ
jgi:hypothetical protein